MLKILFFAPNAPERLRVREQENFYLVEVFSVFVNRWIIVAEHHNLDNAITDAKNWY